VQLLPIYLNAMIAVNDRVFLPTLRARYSSVCTSLVRPRGFQEVVAPRILRQSPHEGGKVVSLKHRPHLPPGKFSGAHFCCRLSGSYRESNTRSPVL
jgi:hypothetical protein